ncbi:TPA: hypothetical protein ACS8DH_000794 [Providencia alcalifaciens]
MLDESKKLLGSNYKLRNASIENDTSRRCFRRISIKSFKISVYSLLIGSLLSFGEVNAQGMEVEMANNVVVTVSKLPQVFSERDLHRIGNKIELLYFISLSSEVMTKPSTQEEGKDSPKESNETEAGLKKEREITQEDIEHFKSSIIGMLLSSLVMIPLGIMFSECISPRILAKRKRWMKLHELKAKRFYRSNPDKHYIMPRKTFCQWLWF